MNIVKIVSGKIFFDEFDNTELNPKWEMIPYLPQRISTSELSGFLKMYHGNPDVYLLVDEPDNEFVLDIRNNYRPQIHDIYAGIVVFKEPNYNLELLEYYDVSKAETYVYEYMRLVKTKDVYIAYGKNTLSEPWEVLGSGYFYSGKKIGLVVKGYQEPSPSFDVYYFRLYRSNRIQIINIPINYKVQLLNESNTILDTKKVLDPYVGVIFTQDDIPPYRRYFKVFNENNELVHTSILFDIVGGDTFYYGAVLNCYINDEKLWEAGEYFLGTFKDSEIPFTVKLENPYENDIRNISIQAVPYDTNPGYDWVKFSNTVDGTYTDILPIEVVSANNSITLYGKVIRDTSVTSSIEPYKFLIRVNYS